MISILLLPFMCLSLAQEGAKAEGKSFSINEITSSVNYDAKKDEEGISLASSPTIHNEGGGSHSTFGSAEAVANIGTTDYDLEIRGKTSKYNKRDVYSIRVADRVRVHFKFAAWGRNMTGAIYDERGKKLFEFTDDDEKYGPVALLKKGIYFIDVNTKDEYDTEYIVSMWSNIADSKETITIDADIMRKYKALVWESDYVPGGAAPVDGTVVKTAFKPSRRNPWRYTGGFYSCKVDEEFLARSIYIWSKDVFQKLRTDIELYQKTAEKILNENEAKQGVVIALSAVSDASGKASTVCSFLSAAAGKVLGAISFVTSFASFIVESSMKVYKDDVDMQCNRLLGALERAEEGKIISIKQNAVIKLYRNDSKYIKNHIYRLRYTPYLKDKNQTYNVVQRSILDPYPTYDMRLHFGGEDEITSDCQGTFKAYTNIDDVKFSLVNGD